MSAVDDYSDDAFEDHDVSMESGLLAQPTTSTVLDSSESQHELQEKFLANETERDEFLTLEKTLAKRNGSPLYASDSQAKIVIPEVDDDSEVQTSLPSISTSRIMAEVVATPQKINKGLTCLRKRIRKHETHKDHLAMETTNTEEEVKSENMTLQNKPPARPNVNKGFLGKKRLTSNPKVEAFSKQEEEDMDFLEGLLNGKKKDAGDANGGDNDYSGTATAAAPGDNSKIGSKRAYYPKGLRKDGGMPAKKKTVRSSGYGQQPRKAHSPPTTTRDNHKSNSNDKGEDSYGNNTNNHNNNHSRKGRSKDKTLSLSPSELAILGMDSNDPIGSSRGRGRVLKSASPSPGGGGHHSAGADNEGGEYDDYAEDFEEDHHHNNDNGGDNNHNNHSNGDEAYENENDLQFSGDDEDAEGGPESSSLTLPGSSHTDGDGNVESRQHSPVIEYKHRNHLTEEQRLEQEKFLEANENDPLIVSPRDLEELNRDTLKHQKERDAGKRESPQTVEGGLRLVHSPKSPTTDNDQTDSNNNNNNDDDDDVNGAKDENAHHEKSVEDAFAEDTRHGNGNQDGDASHSGHGTDAENGNDDRNASSPSHSGGTSPGAHSVSPTVDPSRRVVPYKGVPGVRLGNPHSNANPHRQSQSLPNTSRRAHPMGPPSPTSALDAIERETNSTALNPGYTRSRALNSSSRGNATNKVVTKSPMHKRKTYETAKTLKHKPTKTTGSPPPRGHGNDEISVGGASSTSPTRHEKVKVKPYKKPPLSHFYNEKTGLFSSFEVEAGRESRRETYLIRSLEKKMETLQEVERMRSQNEARSIYEKVQQEAKQESRKQNIKREKMHQRIFREQEEAFERMLRNAKEENNKLKHELRAERTRGGNVIHNNSKNSHYHPKKPSQGAAPSRQRPPVHGRRQEETEYHHDYYGHGDEDEDEYYHEHPPTQQPPAQYYDHRHQQDSIDDGHDHHTQHTSVATGTNNSHTHPVVGGGSSLMDNEGSGSMYYAYSTNNEGEPVIRHNGSGSVTESIIVSGLDGESASVTLQPSVDEGSEGIVDMHANGTNGGNNYQPQPSAHANGTNAIAAVNDVQKHVIDMSNDNDMDLVEMLYSGHQNANKNANNTKNGKKAPNHANPNKTVKSSGYAQAPVAHGGNKIPSHPHQRAAPGPTQQQKHNAKLREVKGSGYAQVVQKKAVPVKHSNIIHKHPVKSRHSDNYPDRQQQQQQQQQHGGNGNAGCEMDWTPVPITLNSDVIPVGPGDNGGGSIVSIGIAEDGSVIVSKSGSHQNSREMEGVPQSNVYPQGPSQAVQGGVDGNSLLEGSSLLYYDIPSVGDTDQATHGLAPTEESHDAVLNGPLPGNHNNIIMVNGEYGEDAFGNPISRNGSVAGIEGLDGYSSVQITDWGGDDDDDTPFIQQQAGGAYPGQQHGLQGAIIGQHSRSQDNSVYTDGQGYTDAHSGSHGFYSSYNNESHPSGAHPSQEHIHGSGGIAIETSDLDSYGDHTAHSPPSSNMAAQEGQEGRMSANEGRMSANRRISTRSSSRSNKPLSPFGASREGKRILTTSTTNNLDISTRTDEALLLSQNSDNNHNEYEEDFEQGDDDAHQVEAQEQNYQMQRTVENSSYEALKIVRKQLQADGSKQE